MNFIKKWYIYQKERFPLLTYGIYIFAVVFGVFCYSNYACKIDFENIPYVIEQGLKYTINYHMLIPMFIATFLQFLMVRIVDEFKDYEEDCKYRPYRPVPRGLIKLSELKILLVICIIIQLWITLHTSISSILWLVVVWIFFTFMSKGFFIKKFLDKHILFEVALDELLMLILVAYLACFIKYMNPTVPLNPTTNISSIVKLLFMSYIISWIVEIARKVRCKEDEEEGVRTYTAVFGIKGAMLILFVLETILMLIHYKILGNTHNWIIFTPYLITNLTNLLFAVKQNKLFAKCASLSANIYILICYFSLGLLIF